MIWPPLNVPLERQLQIEVDFRGVAENVMAEFMPRGVALPGTRMA
jgi:hypothetical protein